MHKRENDEYYNYDQISTPIFSDDWQKAYLNLNHYCGYLCGSWQNTYCWINKLEMDNYTVMENLD